MDRQGWQYYRKEFRNDGSVLIIFSKPEKLEEKAVEKISNRFSRLMEWEWNDEPVIQTKNEDEDRRRELSRMLDGIIETDRVRQSSRVVRSTDDDLDELIEHAERIRQQRLRHDQ